ncbi:MAG: hypothetical protein Fur0018_04600 [Anaerolineales bacterium]
MRHPLAWLAWLAAVLLCLSTTRNPFYLFALLVVITFTGWRVSPRAETGLPFAPLRLLAFFVPLAAFFNALTAHFGDTVLLRLPERIPLLGGALTLEGLVFGALNGILLGGMVLTFQVLNRVLPLRTVLRLVPRAFYPLAVAASIALTFIPLTVRQWEQIRMAQAVRGHRLRGLRDLPPLFLPLLVGGLEHALQLAEAMAARGFAGEAPALDTAGRLALSGGLLSLLCGWLLAAVWGLPAWGWGLMAAGGGALILLLMRRRQAHTHSTYQTIPWRRADTLGALSALLAVTLLLWPGAAHATLAYTPYPLLHPPGFAFLPAAGILMLLLPAL